jgi:hypothetical protein
MKNSMTTIALRLFALGAAAMIALAVLEYAANAFGYTVVHESRTPGRLLESAGLLTVIVIALLLRQIRDELRK